MERKYNVFISFKNSDSNGNKTKDSIIAEKLYGYLTEKGLNVFFSNVELEFIGKAQYTKVIDDALDTSQFLIAVGCSHENLNSQWVRYEWESFINDVRSGIKSNAEVFVLYQDMTINQLPRPLRQHQAFDASEAISYEKLYNFIINSIDPSKRVAAAVRSGLNDVTQGIATEPILNKLDPTISFKDIVPKSPEQREREDRALNDFKQTIKYYTEELRNNPTDEQNIKPKLALAYYECGMLYKEQGKNDMALSDFEKAVNLEPANDSYRECLALIYYNRGYKEQKEYKASIEDLNEALKLEPTNSLYRKTLEGVKRDRNETFIIFIPLVGIISAAIGFIIGAIVGLIIGAIGGAMLKGSVIGLVVGIIIGFFWARVGDRNLPKESE